MIGIKFTYNFVKLLIIFFFTILNIIVIYLYNICLFIYCTTGRGLLLRGTWMHDQEVRRRLRIYYGNFRTFPRIHQALGWMYDSAALQSGHRGLDFQRLCAEAGVSRLCSTRWCYENTCSLLHLWVNHSFFFKY